MSPAPAPRKSDARWTLLAAAPALAVASCQASWPWPFFSDDAFVSLRYAERLLHGHGLTWTDGERVEGYSNLLWTLGCAGLGALGLELVTAARVLGGACTAAALWLLAGALRPYSLRTAVVAAVPPLLVASSGTVLAWTLGGLEGPLVLLCLAAGFGALVRRLAETPDPGEWSPRALLWCGAPFALACWTRPDSPLWVAGAGLALGLASWRRGIGAIVARIAWFAALPVAACTAQLAFRRAYYGEWVPNTAWVKAQFDPGSGSQGLDYVLTALGSLPGLAWPALAGVVALSLGRRTRVVAITLALPTMLWLAYLLAIGGDHFPGRRLLHGALAPMALLAGAGLVALSTRASAQALCGAAMLAAAALGLHQSRTDPKFVEPKYEIWEWRGKVVGEALGRAFAPSQPLLAVDSAGVVPFYSRLPALDMLGLCDRTIGKTPFRPWLLDVKARGEVELPPGHLRGNGDYVMDRAPDLILMGPPPGMPLAVFVSALEFEYDPRFRDGYRCALLDLGTAEFLPGRSEELITPLWVLLHGRAGLRRSPDRIEIPAWLFGSLRLERPLIVRRLPPAPDTPEGAAIAAGLQAAIGWYGERRAVAIPAGAALQLELRADRATLAVPLPAGTWRGEVLPPDAGVALDLTQLAAGREPATFAVDTERVVELALVRASSSALPVRVRQVTLLRVE